MTIRRFIALVLLLSVAAPVTVNGQRLSPDAAGALVARWTAGQARALDRIAPLSFVAHSVRNVDGHFGARNMEQGVRYRLSRGSGDLEQEVLYVRVAGRAWPDRQRRGPGPRRGPDGGGPVLEMLDRVLFPGQAVSRMRIRRVGEERERGGRLIRVEMEPAGRMAVPVDEVTLWFDGPGERLVRSRFVLVSGSGGARLVAGVTYQRLHGVDVPVERQVEGTVQTRRRARSFTTTFEEHSSLEEYTIRDE